jgi:hypothetical protein
VGDRRAISGQSAGNQRALNGQSIIEQQKIFTFQLPCTASFVLYLWNPNKLILSAALFDPRNIILDVGHEDNVIFTIMQQTLVIILYRLIGSLEFLTEVYLISRFICMPKI